MEADMVVNLRNTTGELRFSCNVHVRDVVEWFCFLWMLFSCAVLSEPSVKNKWRRNL